MRMKEAKRRAQVCMAVCAVFTAVGAALTLLDIYFWAEFSPLVGMLCAAECFEAGRTYQFLYEEEAKDRGGFFQQDDFAWVEAKTGLKAKRCETCKGTVFRMVAGRFVCNTCGEVLGVEHGEEETGL